MESPPKISIVIPSFNQGKYLEETILSILNQNYPSYEIIIIDGGSVDETLDIIAKYKEKITYWISEPDIGQASAVNKGINAATGDFIGWQNSDDIYFKNCFWDFAKSEVKFPNYDIYFGNRFTINEKGLIIGKKYLSNISLFYYKYRGMVLTNQTAFFSKQMAISIGKLDENLHFALDNEFFFRAFLNGFKAYHVPRFWGAIRYHSKSKTGKGNEKEWAKEREYICKKHHIPNGLRYKINNKIAIIIRFIFLIKSPTALANTLVQKIRRQHF